MNRYPDNETYKNLYARFYNGRTAQELLKLAYPIRGTTVLDLCGGEGRLGLKAVQGGARFVWLVDKEKSMVNVPILPRMDVIISSVEEFLGQWQCGDQDMHYDRVLCQQAVNYWLDASYAAIVAKLLNPGGIFVFNTFYKKPSEEPTVKKYGLGDKKFVEVSADYVGGCKVREVCRFAGSNPNSQHELGNAADIYCPKKSGAQDIDKLLTLCHSMLEGTDFRCDIHTNSKDWLGGTCKDPRKSSTYKSGAMYHVHCDTKYSK